MDIIEATKTYLKTVADITNLVGSGVNARIYYDQARWEQAKPFITLRENLGESSELLGNAASGQWKTSLSVMAWGDTRTEATDLWDAVRTNMQRSGGETWGTVFIVEVSCPFGRATGVIQPRANSADLGYYVEQTYDIWHAVEALA